MTQKTWSSFPSVARRIVAAPPTKLSSTAPHVEPIAQQGPLRHPQRTSLDETLTRLKLTAAAMRDPSSEFMKTLRRMRAEDVVLIPPFARVDFANYAIYRSRSTRLYHMRTQLPVKAKEAPR